MGLSIGENCMASCRSFCRISRLGNTWCFISMVPIYTDTMSIWFASKQISYTDWTMYRLCVAIWHYTAFVEFVGYNKKDSETKAT